MAHLPAAKIGPSDGEVTWFLLPVSDFPVFIRMSIHLCFLSAGSPRRQPILHVQTPPRERLYTQTGVSNSKRMESCTRHTPCPASPRVTRFASATAEAHTGQEFFHDSIHERLFGSDLTPHFDTHSVLSSGLPSHASHVFDSDGVSRPRTAELSSPTYPPAWTAACTRGIEIKHEF